MNVTLTLRLIDNLRRLLDGESIPYTALPKSLAEDLAREGLVSVIAHKTRRSLAAPKSDALAGALPRYNEALIDLDRAARLLSEDNSRSAQAALSGNSKTTSQRTTPGFLVNSYTPIACTLGARSFEVSPAEGSAVYIADWQSFLPSEAVLIVGVENMENFLKIRSQRELFKDCLRSGESGILFVSRYAFSGDLMKWLEGLPNRYVHFGDFDLAGIDIYLKQFLPHVGTRGSFLIPNDIEERLKRGSRERYDEQYRRYANLSTADQGLTRLITLINRHRRTYDQEGYIAHPSPLAP